MSAPPAPDKRELRRQFRERRRALPDAARAGLDQRIRAHLAREVSRRHARCLSAFLAFDGEPDLAPLLERWRAEGLRIVLPVIPGRRDGDMRLHAWEERGELGHNHLGIREPRAGQAVALAQVDLLLMPLVAFDHAGHRLGMGAAFYDRMLAPVRDDRRPLRVGVAYASQCTQALPADAWDVPLHAVVTEDGWLSLDG